MNLLPGDLLWTRDGRRTGNATFQCMVGEKYHIRTDVGNETDRTEDELRELFFVDDGPGFSDDESDAGAPSMKASDRLDANGQPLMDDEVAS